MGFREYQITVMKIHDGSIFYTAQFRKIRQFWSGRWIDLTPMYQPSYEKAQKLIDNHKANI